MEEKLWLVRVFFQYLAVSGIGVLGWKAADFNSESEINPLSTHSKCISLYLELENARKLKDKEREVNVVNDYWDCHYKYIDKSN